ncbi:MAG: hypothetical protein WD805_01835, partial [Gaiellaceae bacterium]
FLNRETYTSAVVDVFAPGTTTVALRYTLGEAWIQRWVTKADGAANVLPEEELTIAYDTFEQETFGAGANSFCWDFAGGGLPC